MTSQSNIARSPISTQITVQQDKVFPVNQTGSFWVDLSLQTKTGLRGKKASEVIQQAGFILPSSPNQVTDSEQGSVLRLSENEYWLLANFEEELPDLMSNDECYSLFCQDSHAWFAFKSPFQADVMAKVCGVDLRESAFPLGTIAQTVVAGGNAIIAHHTIGQKPLFSILCDRSVADYIWTVMLDAMDEFNVKPASSASLTL